MDFEPIPTTKRDASGPETRADIDKTVGAAREALGDDAFAAAWVRGKALQPEQALSEAGTVTLPEHN